MWYISRKGSLQCKKYFLYQLGKIIKFYYYLICFIDLYSWLTPYIAQEIVVSVLCLCFLIDLLVIAYNLSFGHCKIILYIFVFISTAFIISIEPNLHPLLFVAVSCPIC